VLFIVGHLKPTINNTNTTQKTKDWATRTTQNTTQKTNDWAKRTTLKTQDKQDKILQRKQKFGQHEPH
jgi:hypothetical protein